MYKHTDRQNAHAPHHVGLAQARPNYTILAILYDTKMRIFIALHVGCIYLTDNII